MSQRRIDLAPTIDDGLDIDNLDETSEAEIDTYLTRMWRFRGSLYEVSANSVWLDTRPDFAKLHRWGARLFGRPDPEPMLMMGIANLFSYVHMAWEPGIHNQFRVLQRQGLAKAQLMDIVMVAQLSAGHARVAVRLQRRRNAAPRFPGPTCQTGVPGRAGRSTRTHSAAASTCRRAS